MTSNSPTPLSYKDAGVDIDAGDALVDRIKPDIAKRRAEGVAGPMPADLVTASASGLDPDLSPAAARAQAPRIANARGLPVAGITRLLDAQISHAVLGFIGEDRVNVLALNRALDAYDRRGKAGH